jgi:hypothetical protein
VNPVVAVVGPPSAGSSSLAAALAERLTDHVFVDIVDATSVRAPDAVVVVASAAAPLVASDVDLIARAAEATDRVIAAVSKIDAHRRWRDVLAADRALLARRDDRFRQVPWVGVAAAPDLGAPDVEELVGALVACLARPDRLPHARRPSRSADALAARSAVQRARLTLLYFVRRRCAEIGAELRAGAMEMPRGGMVRFGDEVRDALADFAAELEAAIDAAMDEAIGEVTPTPPRRTAGTVPQLTLPPRSSRRLETRLMFVLGGGFGLGVALTLGRLTTALGSGSDVIGLLIGGVVGLLLTMWVVGIRGVLHDRALMERWVGEVIVTVRNDAEEAVARRLLDAEIAFAGAFAAHNRLPEFRRNHGKRRNSTSESFL